MTARVAGRTGGSIERELALLAVGLAALAPAALVGSDRVLCPIRRATGLPCPACGLTRSWQAATHGRPRESVALHPLGPLALGVAVAYAAGLDERPGTIARGLWRPAIAAGLGAAWVGVWLARVRRASVRRSRVRPAGGGRRT